MREKPTKRRSSRRPRGGKVSARQSSVAAIPSTAELDELSDVETLPLQEESPYGDALPFEESRTADTDVTEGRLEPAWVASSYEQWSRELGKRSLLSRREEIELAKRMEQNDREARDRFIESNLKLVVSIAKRYRGCGVPMEDLIQEGNLGLIKAVDRFDYRKGCRFSTCAVTWIEGQIRRSIGNLRHGIHLPLRVAADLRKVRRISDRLANKLGRQPTHQEIADEMGVEVQHVQDMLSLPYDAISLDETLDEETERLLRDMVEDASAVFPEDALVIETTRQDVRKAIAKLTPRQQTVLKLRYGLEGEREHTLEEIGEKLNLTRQRVWQIECGALKKIKCRDCPKGIGSSR